MLQNASMRKCLTQFTYSTVFKIKRAIMLWVHIPSNQICILGIKKINESVIFFFVNK